MNECPICLQQYFTQPGGGDSAGVVPLYLRCCQNVICVQCISKYIKNAVTQNLQCPMCRANIDMDMSRKQLIVPIHTANLPEWMNRVV